MRSVFSKLNLSKLLRRHVWFCQPITVSTYSKDCNVLKYSSYLNNAGSSYCALKVWQCNAAGGYGVPFTEAFIRVGPAERLIKEGAAQAWRSTRSKVNATTLFGPALERLVRYEEGKLKNGEKHVKEAVSCFKELNEFLDKTVEEQVRLSGIMFSEKYKYNTQAITAAHIFSHLVPLPKGSQRVRLDGQRYHGIIDLCPCGCGQKINLGYTGYGNKDAWYGHADMVIDRCTVSIEPESLDENENHKHEEDISLGEKNILQGLPIIKDKKIVQKNINDSKVFSQFIAQAITNAFFQTNVNPGLGEFLIPSLLVTTKSVYICMYCVEHDLLLFRWPPLSLWHKNLHFNMETMFEVWMTLNFDRLNSPVSDHLLRLASTFDLNSDFPKVIEMQTPGALYNFKESSSPINEGRGDLHTWGDLDLLGSVDEDEKTYLAF